ncbi:MAG: FxSxx-COOH system tetratricopeptide repeat protein [Tepidisphaeraceae bacterium]|jgi:tetratricopeptide (TPR) repeat protein
MACDLFISYHSPDLKLAEELHRQLLAGGFRPDQIWFDKIRLKPGYNWYEHIKDAADAARIILPVLTPRWQLSNWTKFETYCGEVVIPLIFQGSWPDISTPPLQRFHYLAVDLSKPDASAWRRLIDAIREHLANPAPQKPASLAYVRYQHNPYFVGREKEMLAIHETLHQSPTAALTQGKVQAVAALGGVGKSTLAREYVEQFWRCYRQIFWVDCRVGVTTGLAGICDAMFPDLPQGLQERQKAQTALRELNGDEPRLLVLDNAEDEQSIQEWIPNAGGCRTIITSRYSNWSPGIVKLEMYVFDPEPAREFLIKRTGRKAEGDELIACDALAKELGYLPLALEQAAAYMLKNQQYSFSDYLALYRRTAAELLKEKVLGSTEYPDSVATTWKLTIERLTAPARVVLRLASFLADTPIPLGLFRQDVAKIKQAAAQFPVSSPTRDSSDPELFVNSIAADLQAYSMARYVDGSLQFHNLVQKVELHNIPLDQRDDSQKLIWSLFIAFAPTPAHEFANWPAWAVLVPHAQQLVNHPPLDSPSTAWALSAMASYLQEARAAYSQAEPMYRRALEIAEKRFGKDHAKVAPVLTNLAQLLQATNRLSEAEPMMRWALKIGEKSFGKDHPHVATRLNNLAALLQDTNRLSEAEPMMRRALQIDEKSFGKDHPEVATDLNNLAALLQATNRLSEAEPMMRRALEIDEKSFGKDHPTVATRLNNLAQLLKATNCLTEAEPMMRRALEIDEKSFGKDHPKLAVRLNNLALLLQATNRLTEAEPMMRRALEIDEKSFGKDHPNVAMDLNNLAGLFRATNHLTEAEPLMRRAMEIDEKSFGKDHPNVAIRLNNLAQLLQDTNHLTEAEPLMRRHLEIFLEFAVATGHEHPHLREALGNYALLLKEMGRNDQQVQAQLNAVTEPYGIQIARSS